MHDDDLIDRETEDRGNRPTPVRLSALRSQPVNHGARTKGRGWIEIVVAWNAWSEAAGRGRWFCFVFARWRPTGTSGSGAWGGGTREREREKGGSMSFSRFGNTTTGDERRNVDFSSIDPRLIPTDDTGTWRQNSSDPKRL